jgi:hypothetical protein
MKQHARERNIYKIVIGNLPDKGLLEDLDVDGRTIVNFILNQTGCDAFKWIHLA